VGAPDYPSPEQPYPSNYPLAQPPAVYYARPVDLGVLKAICFVLLSVGFFLTSGAYLYMAGDRTFNFDYRTIYYLEASGWLLGGIGIILVSVAEFHNVHKKSAQNPATQMDLGR
jgi:uncharacterized membrane protein YbhN (UPF0104 family)